jgi:hypothetical protein
MTPSPVSPSPFSVFGLVFAQVGAKELPGPNWLYNNFLFRDWQGRFFEKSFFETFTLAVAIGLSLFTAGLFLLERRARALGKPIPERNARRCGIVLTVLAFGLYFDFFNPNTRYVQYYHRHELYHYYLGSKYFTEVGYDRLYGCTAIAEVELGGAAAMRKREIRDLSAANLIMPVVDTYVFKDPAFCKSHFTTERWQEFKQDVKWFEASSRGSYWENMLKDHGYNPPPVWTMTGKFIASLSPAGDHFFKLLSLLDISLQLGTVLMLNWAFGWRVMTLATVFWGCNAPANFYWTGGAFLRQDWIFLLVSSVCLARKRRFMLSGAALTWSSLLRVFPAAYFGGAGLVILVSLIRTRRLHKDYVKFIGGAAIALGVLGFASVQATGPTAYKDFAAHIGLHRDTPLTNHMGLEVMLVHNWDGRMVFTRDDREDDPFEPWKQGRTNRKHQLRPVFLAINVLLVGWLAWALRRTRQLWIGLALVTPLIPTLSNLTCYYYSIFLVVAPLCRLRPSIAPAFLALAGASQVLLGRFYWIDDKYTAQSYLFFAFGLCLLVSYSRPFSLARLQAWLRGKREPVESATLSPG